MLGRRAQQASAAPMALFFFPNLVTAFSGWSRAFIARFLGPEAMLASQSLRASLGRTSVLIAALTTAIAMTVSVGRVRDDSLFDVKLVAMGDNVVRGAAGASVLNAELMVKCGLLPR